MFRKNNSCILLKMNKFEKFIKGLIGGKISSRKREEKEEDKRKCGWFSLCQLKLNVNLKIKLQPSGEI
jgi:hypothetical protein